MSPRTRSSLLAVAAAGVSLTLLGGVLAAQADTAQTSRCVDGGGTTWSGRAVWGAEYTASAGVKKVSIDVAGFTSRSLEATTADYSVRSFDGSGRLLQTLSENDRAFDFARGNAYLNRNPLNPPSAPGRAKVLVNVGDGNDGRGNCTMTFTQPASTNPSPSPTANPTSAANMTAYVTGYTYWDNTPPGSADISHPVLHSKAGGVGTYADPITMAVGHSLASGRDVLDFPAGTRFYLPYLQKYFIVEDSCGDGSSPENGPCHRHPAGVDAWLDIWLDGREVSSSSADACARRITGNHAAIKDPANNLTVQPGSVC